MPHGTRPTRSEFLSSVSDCIGELEDYKNGEVFVSLDWYKGPRKDLVLAWRVVFLLGEDGLLHSRSYRKAAPVYTKTVLDPIASLYNLLIEVIREVEKDPQSKFWRGDQQA